MQYHTEAVKKGRSSREAERAAAKHDKSRTALRQSDSVYQSSVAEAEESRQGRISIICASILQNHATFVLKNPDSHNLPLSF